MTEGEQHLEIWKETKQRLEYNFPESVRFSEEIISQSITPRSMSDTWSALPLLHTDFHMQTSVCSDLCLMRLRQTAAEVWQESTNTKIKRKITWAHRVWTISVSLPGFWFRGQTPHPPDSGLMETRCRRVHECCGCYSVCRIYNRSFT